MSIPRVLLAPTHETALADAVAAAVAELASGRGQRVRYHHVGPLSPMSCWDRWEGAAFVDPALCTADALVGLYDVATRGATLSLLSSSVGLVDSQDGISWVPVDVARLLDCPVVVVLDCRGWGTGIRVLVSGLRSRVDNVDLAGAVLTGVADREHFVLLRKALAEDQLPVVGCLFEGDGPGWQSAAPGAWGLPLEAELLDAVSRQVDLGGLMSLAGRRGFLAAQNWMTDRGLQGPLVAVAGGKGFTPWSRDSIEVLRAAGAQVRRLDLLEDHDLPPGTAGLVLAGTLWPASVPDLAMNTSLLAAIRGAVAAGLPTLALGGGMLLLLDRVHDSLGRTSDLAGVIHGEGEILWDLQEPAYAFVLARKESLLFRNGEAVTGWVTTEAEIDGHEPGWDSPLTAKTGDIERPEGMSSDSLLASRVFVHLASLPEMAPRFVRTCVSYAARSR